MKVVAVEPPTAARPLRAFGAEIADSSPTLSLFPSRPTGWAHASYATARDGAADFQCMLTDSAIACEAESSMVIDFANGTTCTFSTTGTYNSATAVLSGSYSAVTNCAGDTGTYSLTQQCTDTITSVRRRDGTGVVAC